MVTPTLQPRTAVGHHRLPRCFVIISKTRWLVCRAREDIAAIRGGRIQLVVLLARWLGHSEAGAIPSVCRSVDLRYVIVDGGLSSAWSMITLEMGGA